MHFQCVLYQWKLKKNTVVTRVTNMNGCFCLIQNSLRWPAGKFMSLLSSSFSGRQKADCARHQPINRFQLQLWLGTTGRIHGGPQLGSATSEPGCRPNCWWLWRGWGASERMMSKDSSYETLSCSSPFLLSLLVSGRAFLKSLFFLQWGYHFLCVSP